MNKQADSRLVIQALILIIAYMTVTELGNASRFRHLERRVSGLENREAERKKKKEKTSES